MSLIKLIFRPIFHFFAYYITNYIVSFIPVRFIRKFWLKAILRAKIGKKTYLDMGTYFLSPWRLKIGDFTHINRRCFIDSRDNVSIGNCVSISHNVSIITASHDIDSKTFIPVSAPITIGDYVFLGANSIVLKGVAIGNGAIVCAGAVVTKDVPDFSVVAGIPAKVVGFRNRHIDYKCNPHSFFF